MAEFTVKLPRQLMNVSNKSEEEIVKEFKSVGMRSMEMTVCMGNDTIPEAWHLSALQAPFIQELLTVSVESAESHFEVHEGNVGNVLKIIGKHDVRVIEDIL